MTNLRLETPSYGAVPNRPHRPGERLPTVLIDPAHFDSLVEDRRKAAQPIVFIHGFNVAHDEATRRARAISALLGNRAPVVALTWPSYAKVTPYPWDEANNEWVRDRVLVELRRLAKRHGNLIIVAHSMGGRILLDALERAPDLRGRVTRAIFAAPDIDRDQFQRAVQPGGWLDIPVTVYVSTRDQALSASWRTHGHPRAGDRSYWVSGRTGFVPFAVGPNVEMVDLSRSRGEPLGHANFIMSWQGAADLCRVLTGTAHEAARSVIADGHRYWLVDETVPADSAGCDRAAIQALSILGQRPRPKN